MNVFLPHEYTIKRLRELGPSERLVYFIGFLEDERLKDPHGPISLIANVAYSLAEEKRVHLTQKRLSVPIQKGTGFINWERGIGRGFSYIATGVARNNLPRRWL